MERALAGDNITDDQLTPAGQQEVVAPPSAWHRSTTRPPRSTETRSRPPQPRHRSAPPQRAGTAGPVPYRSPHPGPGRRSAGPTRQPTARSAAHRRKSDLPSWQPDARNRPRPLDLHPSSAYIPARSSSAGPLIIRPPRRRKSTAACAWRASRLSPNAAVTSSSRSEPSRATSAGSRTGLVRQTSSRPSSAKTIVPVAVGISDLAGRRNRPAGVGIQSPTPTSPPWHTASSAIASIPEVSRPASVLTRFRRRTARKESRRRSRVHPSHTLPLDPWADD